ncbi:MAG: (Fe-S)-binding protein [Firmicutes bacterium]|nr:(Fe-S)-binding protein [Bacillota bacterium]
MAVSISEQVRDLLKEKMNRQLLYYLDICARCGICKDACHIYRATGRVEHVPSYRAEVLRRVYNKYLAPLGRLRRDYGEVTEEDLQKMYEAAFTCTGCRRCMVYCPFGIDITWLISMEKAVLSSFGRVPEELSMLADAAVEKGKSIELYREIMAEQIKSYEPELRARTGMPEASIPIGEKGARVLYVALAGIHSILPAAIIFNLAGEDWTLSMFEAANYGYFSGETSKAAEIAKRIVDEAEALGVKEVVITECGHAFRVMKYLAGGWLKRDLPFRVRSIFQPFAEYLRDGRLKVHTQITEPVTYHDPCQLGRNGGVYEEPREIIKTICTDFREMTPNREKNWCCGGGGGLVAQTDLENYRAETGRLKAEQIKATGAKTVATPCENCRLQLALLNERYDLGVTITAVTDMLVEAVAVPAAKGETAEEISR